MDKQAYMMGYMSKGLDKTSNWKEKVWDYSGWKPAREHYSKVSEGIGQAYNKAKSGSWGGAAKSMGGAAWNLKGGISDQLGANPVHAAWDKGKSAVWGGIKSGVSSVASGAWDKAKEHPLIAGGMAAAALLPFAPLMVGMAGASWMMGRGRNDKGQDNAGMQTYSRPTDNLGITPMTGVGSELNIE